jgi:hypothetical protein
MLDQELHRSRLPIVVQDKQFSRENILTLYFMGWFASVYETCRRGFSGQPVQLYISGATTGLALTAMSAAEATPVAPRPNKTPAAKANVICRRIDGAICQSAPGMQDEHQAGLHQAGSARRAGGKAAIRQCWGSRTYRGQPISVAIDQGLPDCESALRLPGRSGGTRASVLSDGAASGRSPRTGCIL